MTYGAPLIAFLVLAACTGDNSAVILRGGGRAADAVEVPLGQPAQYVCLRYLANGACLRSEWRCPMPTQLMALDGRPRCVMPGSQP